ncbi:serine/threonine-protein kinase [Haloferula sp. BvORR071]|uniref:serine/threonine-protein kinase n=1 Tax=Haloferula sp. BvORR071 TaxID=1396141 RepID=UPI0006965881|nr:serine/threonine-protein kinase [Haloferula sp. BvORR071]
MNFSPEQVIEIFNQALERPVTERSDCLDRACAGDTGLRDQVEGLLRAHDSAGEFLEEGMNLIPSGKGQTIGERPGQRVGRYTLLEQIGEGGCGVVYRAEQHAPVRREVALKVVKPGMDSNSVIARFESERQALAMMEHPHIAQVYDAGATASGRPYFVMELVRGEKITSYCDGHSLTVRARLELFVQVCHAIQHAHQKGIIHRDIKPSNLLVSTTGEGSPLPKVIDFGIAKAMSGEQLTDKTLFTAQEMLMGTPNYMSPEQAAMKSSDLDTRTDIYSLGVLLYELLTGVPPFGLRDPFKSGLDEVRRDILDKVPLRPSARLKAMPAADLGKVAELRQSEPLKLVRMLRHDLDWIVMKAMEKDRTRRYPTANALAMEVQRYLADEPVAARPPSLLYQLGKLAARNRLLVGGIAVIALLLVGSLAVVSVLLAREKAAHQQAEIEKDKARKETAKNIQVSGFLGKMLTGDALAVAPGRDLAIVRDLLARTDQAIGKELADQPEVEAKLRSVMGESYSQMGDHASAERMFRRTLELCKASFPPDGAGVAVARTQLGQIVLMEGRYDEAEDSLESARALWIELGEEEGAQGMLTIERLAILRSRQKRHEEAEALMRRVLAWREKNLGPDHPDVVNGMSNLAVVIHDSKRYKESEPMFREVLAARQHLGEEDSPEEARTLSNLSAALLGQGRSDEGRECLARAVAAFRKGFHVEHPERLDATFRLAELYRNAGVFAEAEPLYREYVAHSLVQGGDYSNMADVAIGCLVVTLQEQKKFAEADAVFDQLLAPEFAGSPQFVPVLEMRTEFRSRTGRWREAAEDAARLVAIKPDKQDYYHRLAPALAASGDEEAYRKLCAEILTRFAATTDRVTAHRMAKCCLMRPASAGDLEAVARMLDLPREEGADDVSAPSLQVCKALAELRRGDFTAAAELAAGVGDSMPQPEAAALAVRAIALQAMKRPEDAAAALGRASAVFEGKLPKIETMNLGRDWRDWIIARDLLAEARAMVVDGKTSR